ncbi:hypothetical protein [Mycobacterium simiae]|uniref:hypothetical protein n=1 Tax=Mycobacterium simiae TaxID=1784 RepID=UPI002617906F|nr:hypothetical protein [Mycobacterium simiae]
MPDYGNHRVTANQKITVAGPRSGMTVTTTVIDAVHVLTLYGVFDCTTYPRIHHTVASTADHIACRALIVDVTQLAVPDPRFWRQFSTSPLEHQPAEPLAVVCGSIAGQQLLRRSPISGIIPLYWSVAAAIAALRIDGDHARLGWVHTDSHPESQWLTSWATTPIETRHFHLGPSHPRPDSAVAQR